jgi:flagellar transcriptional activator FlhC
MKGADRAETTLLAKRLILAGFRAAIVRVETGLSSGYVRNLFASYLGTTTEPGQLPQADAILSTRRTMIEGSLLMSSYIEFATKDWQVELDIEALMLAHGFYLQARKDAASFTQGEWQPISVSEAWVIARDLRTKNVMIQHCRCGCRYLTVYRQRISMICHICKIRQETYERIQIKKQQGKKA